MARLGSIKYQVSQILQKVNGIGTSKKDSKSNRVSKVLKVATKLAIKYTASRVWRI